MKITRVESIVLTLPMVIDGATPMLGGRARTAIDMLLVRIESLVLNLPMVIDARDLHAQTATQRLTSRPVTRCPVAWRYARKWGVEP